MGSFLQCAVQGQPSREIGELAEARARRALEKLREDLMEVSALATIATCFHFHAPHIAYLPFSLFS